MNNFNFGGLLIDGATAVKPTISINIYEDCGIFRGVEFMTGAATQGSSPYECLERLTKFVGIRLGELPYEDTTALETAPDNTVEEDSDYSSW